MLERIGLRFESWYRQYMPDPFLLALILTLATFLLAFFLAPESSFPKLIQQWFYGSGKNDGFWGLLTFAMQMVLIVVTGEAVAASPLIHRAIKALAAAPRTPASAVAFVSFVSMLMGWLHWGFGLISAALLAREVAAQAKARGMKIHYPLLGAAAYTSLLIWHGGLSASAPLLVNTDHHFLYAQIGQVPLQQTIFTPMNFVACALLLFIVPFVLAAMTPLSGQIEISAETLAEMQPIDAPRTETSPAQGEPRNATISEKINSSPLVSWLIAALGIAFLISHFRTKGLELDPDIVNFVFLMLGLLLHRSPVAYMKAVTQSVRGTAGIVLQFPFYAGIMGIMKGSGLGHVIGAFFVQFASANSLPFFAFLSSVFSKLFVPSGGGEWAVEGPVMLEAAKNLSASYGKTIMAVAYGNMVGNMFQPFWALPLLGIMNLRAREIMGYCLVVFCFALPILGVVLLVM